MPAREKKVLYEQRMHELLGKYDKAFLVGADNVGSKQFQEIRRGLRGLGEILMGKNTLMKRCIRTYVENTGNTDWELILPCLVGNVGIVFTASDLNDVKTEIGQYKVPAPARVGAAVQCDVTIPKGMTGMEASQTSFFQALNISTKINKGNIEILNDVHILKKGEKVGASEAALLGKLDMKPFAYGLTIEQVFESGSLYAPAVLEITDEDMMASVAAAVGNVAALSLGAGYPTLASVPHSVINGYKNVLAIALETEYSFPLADKVKEILANPEAFAAAAAPAAAAATAAAPEPEPEEESDEDDGGFDLFD